MPFSSRNLIGTFLTASVDRCSATPAERRRCPFARFAHHPWSSVGSEGRWRRRPSLRALHVVRRSL